MVVVTHHAPHPRSIPLEFEGHPRSPCYASDLEALIKMLQRGRIDAIYANPEVVRQRLQQMGLAANSVRLDPGLPKLVTHFHLSSSQRRDLLERFDRFLDAQPQLLPTLQRRYGISE